MWKPRPNACGWPLTRSLPSEWIRANSAAVSDFRSGLRLSRPDAAAAYMLARPRAEPMPPADLAFWQPVGPGRDSPVTHPQAATTRRRTPQSPFPEEKPSEGLKLCCS